MGYLKQRKRKKREDFIFSFLLSALAFCSILGFSSTNIWQVDIFGEARLQYLYFSIAVFVVALFKLRFISVFFAFLIAVFNFAIISSSVPFFYENQTQNGENPFTLMYHNVETTNQKTKLIFNNIKKSKADIALISEANPKLIKKYENTKTDFSYIYDKKYRGLSSLLLLSKFEPKKQGVIELSANYFALWANYEIKGHKFTIVGTHLNHPWPQQKVMGVQVSNLVKFINSRNEPVVLIGSMSANPWSSRLLELKTKARLEYRGKLKPSWPSSLPFIFRVPVDQIYSHPGIYVNKIKLFNSANSDHKALIAKVSFIKKNQNDTSSKTK